MRNVYIALIAFFGMVGFAHGLFAAPPAGGYAPGQTLDPNCAPGDADCFVLLTSSPWEVSGSNIFYDAGTVGIGTNSPNSSSILDLSSTTLGLLTPRMTDVERDAIVSPATGLLIFNTADNQFNFYDGTDWVIVGVGNSAIQLTGENTLTTSSLSAGQNGQNNIFFGSSAGFGTDTRFSNFFGPSAGFNAANAINSNFIGNNAGLDATNASFSNFFGPSAGLDATNALGSNFFGPSAGLDATNAANSNFFGSSAGSGATNAANSNFFGPSAGFNATNAANSNFFGPSAGSGATNASFSNFFGISAGSDATNASFSNFFGLDAGSGATNASSSNFFGLSAGSGATNAANSIFIGTNAGLNDTVDNVTDPSGTSILIGNDTSTGGFSNSIVLGAGGTNTAANQLLIGDSYINLSLRGVNYVLPSSDGASGNVLTTNGSGVLSWAAAAGGGSPITLGSSGDTLYTPDINAGEGDLVNGGNIFLGPSAGRNAPGAFWSNFLGVEAGRDASNAFSSNFLGFYAGYGAAGANNSNFFGSNAGEGAIGAGNSNFFGYYAGNYAENAFFSNFFGESAGNGATNAAYSNFFGQTAGTNATNANNSNFFGTQAGLGAVNAANSIFIGTNAGFNDTVDNTLGGSSILIGGNTTTGGFSNSIAIGEGAANTSSNEFMIGSSLVPIDSTRIIGSAGTECTITTGTGIACSSDERLKDNIENISNGVLEKVRGLRAVTYTWLQDENSSEQVGFLAQQLEEYFPQIVATNNQGYKSVFYSQMTPILTKAIQELSDVVYGIFENLETRRVQTAELCVGSTCITEEQFLEVFGSTGQSASVGQNGQDQNEVVEDTQNSENQQVVPGEDGGVLDESQNQENTPEIILTETESSQEQAGTIEETVQEGEDTQNIESSHIE